MNWEITPFNLFIGEDNFIKAPGYYCKTYPKEMNAHKLRLEEFIPIGKNEKS